MAKAQSNELISYLANDKYGYSSQQGKIVIQPVFAGADFFTHGFARVFLPLLEIGKNGPNVCFINSKGQNIFKDTFQNASTFFYLLIEEQPGIFYSNQWHKLQKRGNPCYFRLKVKSLPQKLTVLTHSKSQLLKNMQNLIIRFYVTKTILNEGWLLIQILF